MFYFLFLNISNYCWFFKNFDFFNLLEFWEFLLVFGNFRFFLMFENFGFLLIFENFKIILIFLFLNKLPVKTASEKPISTFIFCNRTILWQNEAQKRRGDFHNFSKPKFPTYQKENLTLKKFWKSLKLCE